MRKGYLVTYSTGSYDTYFIQNDRVYFDKTKAEERCKKLDKMHEAQESMFVKVYDEWGTYIGNDLSDEELSKTWGAIQYEADCYRDEHSEEFPDLWKNNMTAEEKDAWSKQDEKNELHYEEILKNIIRERFPNWDEFEIAKAILIEEQNEEISQEEYGDAQIEEIDIYED